MDFGCLFRFCFVGSIFWFPAVVTDGGDRNDARTFSCEDASRCSNKCHLRIYHRYDCHRTAHYRSKGSSKKEATAKEKKKRATYPQKVVQHTAVVAANLFIIYATASAYDQYITGMVMLNI